MKKLIIIAFVFIGIGSINGQTKKKVVSTSNSVKSKTITTNNKQVVGLGTKTFNGQFIDGIAKYTYYEDSITHKYIKDGLFTYTYNGVNCTQTASGYFKKGLKTGTWNNNFTMKDFRKTDVYGNNERYCTGTVTLISNYKNGYANGNWKLISSYKGRKKFTYYDGSFKSWGNFEPIKTLVINMNFNNGSIVGPVYINDEFKNFTAKGSYDNSSMCIGTWIINDRSAGSNYEIIYKENMVYEFIPRDNAGNIKDGLEKNQEEYDLLLKSKSLSIDEQKNLGISINKKCGAYGSATYYIFDYFGDLLNRDYFLYEDVDGDLSYDESWMQGAFSYQRGFHGGCYLEVKKW